MTAFLVVVMIVGGHSTLKSAAPHEDMASCRQTLVQMKVVVPNGDENESGAVAFCSRSNPFK